MPKSELVKGIRLPPMGGSTATFSGGRIIPGSLPTSALAVSELSAITANLGTVTAGTLRLNGPDASYLKITNIPYLAIEMAIPDGRMFWRARADTDPKFFLGLPNVGDMIQPLTVDATGKLTIQNSSIVMVAVARTLLGAGYMDLMAGGAANYDVAQNAIRLRAGWGIGSKEGGVESLFWDASQGRLYAGQYRHVWLGTYGLSIETDLDYGQTAVRWRSDYQLAAAGSVAKIVTIREGGTVRATTMDIRVYGTTGSTANEACDTAQLRLFAIPRNLTTGAPDSPGSSIIIRDGPDDSEHTYYPGIFMTSKALDINVPSGGVSITGNLTQAAGFTLAGQLISTPYTSDMPPSMADAEFGRLMPWITTGGTRVLLMGLGTTVGWWDLFHESLIT